MQKTLKRYFPIFVVPTLIAFAFAFIIPFIEGVYLSFCKFTTVGNAHWVGLENYKAALTSQDFTYSFWVTAAFTVISVITVNVFAFCIALLLTRKLRGTNFFRTVFFLPNLIGGIVLGYTWQQMINAVLFKYGTTIVSQFKYGFVGLIILMNWQLIGYMMIIYIAGLQAIPEDMLEAAKIDGASSWKTLWNITIPNIMPSITICTFLSLTNGFKLYDQNLALTGGSPFKTLADGNVIKTTEMLALNIVNSNTSNSKGPGQAKAVVFFILVAIISIAQLVSTRKKEVDQ